MLLFLANSFSCMKCILKEDIQDAVLQIYTYTLTELVIDRVTVFVWLAIGYLPNSGDLEHS